MNPTKMVVYYVEKEKDPSSSLFGEALKGP